MTNQKSFTQPQDEAGEDEETGPPGPSLEALRKASAALYQNQKETEEKEKKEEKVDSSPKKRSSQG